MNYFFTKYHAFYVFVVLASFAFKVKAQPLNYRFVEVKGHTGIHMYSGDDLNPFLEKGYGAYEFRFGWQMDGSKGWEHNYRYPSFGLGWYSGFVGSPTVIGNPNAFFGFVSFPLSKLKRHVWISEAGLGLAYSLRKYDPVKNPLNDAIGTSLALYYNYSFGGRFAINREMDLLYAVDVTHISNGRMAQPNHGLNMVGVNLGMRYHFNKLQRKNNPGYNPDKLWDVRPSYDKQLDENLRDYKESNFLIHLAGGFSQNLKDKNTNVKYFDATSMVEFQKFFHFKHAAVVGLDFFYDGNMLGFDEDPYEVGYHVGYDYKIWRCTIRMQVGSYIYAPDMKGAFFMRPAGKYDINDRWFAQLGLKTRAGIAADWLEWGIGVRL
ncbi:acyloxyacyl hydrolase [Owenweeksia hongkongensis]|uniref:acyloxyacyl hydrolase n=1 Tax=Owenweeksia hongkongensis TaxID=253245 RepID=UPI003A8D82B5